MSEVGTLGDLNLNVGDTVKSAMTISDIIYTVVEVMECGVRLTWVGCGKSYESVNTFAYSSHIYTVISRANHPKPWSALTAEEKGALLLAWHDKKVIEEWVDIDGLGYAWLAFYPQRGDFDDSSTYRIRPQPKIKMVTKYRRADNGGWTSSPDCTNTTHRLTYNEIDGVPDCGSVKMEPI